MPYWQQNLTTNIVIGPVWTSALIPTTGGTTATLWLMVSKNGTSMTSQNLTTLVMQSSHGYYRVDLSSASVATLGPIILFASMAAFSDSPPIFGDVISSDLYSHMFGTSGFATEVDVWTYTSRALTSAGVVWTETSRLLSSGGAVWTVSSRDLSTYAGLSSAVWEQPTSRLLTSGAAIWAAATRTITSAAAIWTETTRDLTTASVVWTATSRTLTSTPVSTWGASDVWGYATRLLTSAAAVWTETTRTVTGVPASTWGPTDVWNFSTRLLTSGLAVAPDVWLNSTRTLTSGLAVAPDVWTNSTRTLSSANIVWAETSRLLSSAGVVWSQPVDGTLTFAQAMKVQVAVNLGNSTGGGTTAISFRNWASTVDRISYTVTTAGNRVVSTYDLT